MFDTLPRSLEYSILMLKRSNGQEFNKQVRELKIKYDGQIAWVRRKNGHTTIRWGATGRNVAFTSIGY